MERTEFRALLEPLLAAFGKKFDVPAWTVYYQALADIPPRLLEAAVVRVARENRAFFPRTGELRAVAETIRLELLAAQPWRPCEACAALRGFVETEVDGVRRLQHCACKQRHRDALAAGGLPTAPLIAERQGQHDDAALWNDVPESTDPRQLPPGVAVAVKRIAREHQMPASLPRQTDPDGRPLR